VAHLVCPTCRGALSFSPDAYRCGKCGAVYRVRDGIPVFVTGEIGEADYNPNHLVVLAGMERRHFWHIGRKELIFDTLHRACGDRLHDLLMVELGCGNGGVSRHLEQKGAMIEAGDLHFGGLRFCRAFSSMPLYQLSAAQTPFADAQFDVVGLFDVLEHLTDDTGILAELNRICKPGGLLLLTVPALPRLWSYFDVASGHKRRYRRQDLTQKIAATGFSILRISYFMTLLLPLLWASRMLEGLFRNSATPRGLDAGMEMRTIPVVNGFLLSILRVERFLLRFVTLPVGASLIAVARKVNGVERP
jgi:SAM-dependent methyltransferase